MDRPQVVSRGRATDAVVGSHRCHHEARLCVLFKARRSVAQLGGSFQKFVRERRFVRIVLDLHWPWHRHCSLLVGEYPRVDRVLRSFEVVRDLVVRPTGGARSGPAIVHLRVTAGIHHSVHPPGA